MQRIIIVVQEQKTREIAGTNEQYWSNDGAVSYEIFQHDDQDLIDKIFDVCIKAAEMVAKLCE